MPDTLPPLVDIPEDLASAPLAPTSSPAAWAATFGGSGTNLAQRNRYNADLTAHAKAVQDAQAAHLQDTLAHDKGAQDLYFRQKQLDSLNDNRDQQMALRQQAFDLAQKQKDLQIETAKAKLVTAHAQIDQSNLAATELNDALSNGTVKAGTPEHAALVSSLVGKYPAAAGTPFMASAFKSARIQADPQDILDRFNELKDQVGPDTEITTDKKGIPQLSRKSDNATANLLARTDRTLAGTADLQASTANREALPLHQKQMQALQDYHAVEAERSRINATKNPDPYVLKLIDARRTVAMANAKEVGLNLDGSVPAAPVVPAPAAAPVPSSVATKERIAVNPKTGEKVAFRNGKWEPLQ
jgi:hypothetical protein